MQLLHFISLIIFLISSSCPALAAIDRELYPHYNARILYVAEGYENSRGDRIVRLASEAPKEPFGERSYGAYFFKRKTSQSLQQLGFTRAEGKQLSSHGYWRLSELGERAMTEKIQSLELKLELLPDVRVPVKVYEIPRTGIYFYINTSKFYPSYQDYDLWFGSAGKLGQLPVQEVASLPLRTWQEPHGVVIRTTEGSELYMPVAFSNHLLVPTWKGSPSASPIEIAEVPLTSEVLARLGVPSSQIRPQLSTFCDLSWKRSAGLH